jgi:SAM-dependent methyltransferase
MWLSTLRSSADAVGRRLRRVPPHDVLNRRLIARYVFGKSFADVGAMWNVHGAYAFHAVDVGATAVVALDLMPASHEFHRANAAVQQRVRFVQGDLNQSNVTDALGQFDVVFCSGVLYHVPDPLWTLGQLRRLCRHTLILGSATIPERRDPQLAVFLPHLDAPARRHITYRTPYAKQGLDTPFASDARYANWFWGFTPSCVVALLRAAEFDVVETYIYRHAVCVVASPSATALASH